MAGLQGYKQAHIHTYTQLTAMGLYKRWTDLLNRRPTLSTKNLRSNVWPAGIVKVACKKNTNYWQPILKGAQNSEIYKAKSSQFQPMC